MVKRALLRAGALVLLGASPLAAQVGLSPPLDTASLGHGPYSSMHTLLEKTIFKVDVLTLDIRFGDSETRDFESLVAGNDYSRPLADSLAALAIRSRNAFAEIVFERGISLGQFLDGIREDLDKARTADIISDATYRQVTDSLPVWFGFLRERGIEEDDRLLYRIRGDTLRTVFVSVDGDVPLDHVDVAASARRSVLGSYYAPGSSFREGLIRSLFARGDE